MSSRKKSTQNTQAKNVSMDNIIFEDGEDIISNIKLHKMVKGAKAIKEFLKNKNVVNR